MKQRARETFLDVGNTSFDEWLDLLREPPDDTLFERTRFPSLRHRQECLDQLHSLSDSDVRTILRNFLVCTGSTEIDMVHAELVITGKIVTPDHWDEHRRRLVRHFLSKGAYPAWEGVHWIIDLLPHHPRKALQAIDAFILARCQQLSDNYFDGLVEAATIVRHRYIESAITRVDASATLDRLDWRELEWLVGALYRAIGYDVTVTTRSDDDGIDVLAREVNSATPVHMVIQVKKWASTNPVEKADVRELVGAMDHARATSGVLVTTGRFSSGAQCRLDEDPRLSAVGRDELIRLLNEHCGSEWYRNVDRLLADTKRGSA